MKVENDGMKKAQPVISYFALFDGHNGYEVAECLKESLHNYIINDNIFNNPVNSILEGFTKAESLVLNKMNNNIINSSCGSCALISVLIDDICHVANLGSSKGFISLNFGKRIYNLIEQHKTYSIGGNVSSMMKYNARSSLTRSIGDIDFKFKGEQSTMTAIPDVVSFKIHPEMDFIVLASDELFDVLTNKEIVIIVINICIDGIKQNKSFTTLLTEISKGLIKEALDRSAKDNLSCIFMCFDNLYKSYLSKDEKSLKAALSKLGMKNDYEKLYDDLLNKNIYETPVISDKKMEKNKEKKEKKGFFFRCCGIFN